MGWRWKSSFIKVTTSGQGISIGKLYTKINRCKIDSTGRETRRLDLLGEIIGVEEGLFFLVVMSVLGRAKPDRG